MESSYCKEQSPIWSLVLLHCSLKPCPLVLLSGVRVISSSRLMLERPFTILNVSIKSPSMRGLLREKMQRSWNLSLQLLCRWAAVILVASSITFARQFMPSIGTLPRLGHNTPGTVLR